MTTLTAKENYLRVMHGEMPEYVPTSGPYKDRHAVALSGPMSLYMPEGRIFGQPGIGPEEYTDQWGVPHITTKETGYQALPKPGDFILDDINHWEKIIKHPVIPENFDWEAKAKEDLKNIDRSKTAVNCMWGHQTPFQQLASFMGFTNGLCAMIEEPEKTEELLNYLADYYVPLITKILDYYKPDIMGIADDTATATQPFFSLEVFKDLYVPIYKRFAQPMLDRGIVISYHNCGRCEDFLEDMVEDVGINSWNPAQTSNDLLAVKEKFKGRLAICGGWSIPTDMVVNEENIRNLVRETIDKYAPGGGYSFEGGFMVDADDYNSSQVVMEWIRDEVYEYGTGFYK